MIDIKLPDIGKKETAKEKEEEIQSISIAGKRKKDCAKLLESLGIFNEVKKNNDAVEATIVESTDRKKNPYSYIHLKAGKDCITAEYTVRKIVPNSKKRRLDVMRNIFMTVSFLESKGGFEPDPKQRYLLQMECMDMCENFLDANSLKIKHEYDRIVSEHDVARKELERLKKENETLSNSNLELERRNSHLDQRVSRLEGMTDRELDREIIKWVEEHHGEINDEKFCSVFGLKMARLEERLDAMAKEGIIRIL
jgi:hypothetical protein